MKINKDNYKEVLIQYLEKELSGTENEAVEQYIRENEMASMELDLLKRTRLIPAETTGFPNKQLLFRKEDDRIPAAKPAPVVKLMRFVALAVAAAFIGFGVIIYLNRDIPSSEFAHSVKLGIKTNSGHDKLNDLAAINEGPGTDKANHNKIEIHKKDNRKNINPKDQKKGTKTPPNEVPEKHRTILLVNDPAKNEMAFIRSSTENIDNDEFLITGGSYVPVVQPEQNTSGQRHDRDRTIAETLVDFIDKVSVKRKNINDKTYYALSIETDNIKIDKTFKSLIDK
jgi:hypothetical protein